MKNNLPEKPHNTSAMPVGANGDAPASQFPDAQPTCAPDALICPTRVDLEKHWLNNIPSYAAIEEWQRFIKWLAASPMNPALN